MLCLTFFDELKVDALIFLQSFCQSAVCLKICTDGTPAPFKRCVVMKYSLLLLLFCIHNVVAVSDGVLEPPSNVKWGCGILSVVFVYVILPYWGRDGVDPVMAYVICWTIMGCWVLYGIAN